MDTIKGFVKTVWQLDPDVHRGGVSDPEAVWSKPDERAGSLELRRITTRDSRRSPGAFKNGVRSDFYELYWADLTGGTPWEEFRAWLATLLWRNPRRNVPARLRSAWLALWLVTLAFGLIGLWAAIPPETQLPFGIALPDAGGWRWLILPVIAAGTVALHREVQKGFGRVARYTRATPSNIAARKAVRERGLALLQALHDDEDYGRIILVGPSLGSILAYELLAFFWARQGAARRMREGTPEFEALQRLECAAAGLETEPDNVLRLAAWDEAQRDLRRRLAARPLETGTRWILSDLVTVGSPLAHAEFLIAADRTDLERRQVEREMPIAPPVREPLEPGNEKAARASGGFPMPDDPTMPACLFSFPMRDEAKCWELHHAAPFAAVRWANLHDPARFILFGDLISGPLRPVLGPAIEDIDLAALRGPASHFTHSRYWHPEADGAALAALRRAINLLDEPRARLSTAKGAEPR
ncbi:hypothetical protein SAMN04487976_1354 [Xaviernesmea oryzae]|nr:hypothetical protein SAMN04487976_1354 [Xaviernesmea oryzae]